MINPVQSSSYGSGPSTSTPTGSSALDKNSFVKLLMTQLANQDPTSPMDSQAFVAQLAQFAQVEQLQNASNQLDAIALAQASANQLSTVSLVGRTVRYRSDSVSLDASGTAPIHAELGADAAKVSVRIVDSTGKTVRTLNVENEPKGALDLTWDGLDDNGKPLAAGSYTVAVSATDGAGKPVTADLSAWATVRGVSFQNGYAELTLDGDRHVKLAELVEIRQGA